jgi:hypothetical protein
LAIVIERLMEAVKLWSLHFRSQGLLHGRETQPNGVGHLERVVGAAVLCEDQLTRMPEPVEDDSDDDDDQDPLEQQLLSSTRGDSALSVLDRSRIAQ